MPAPDLDAAFRALADPTRRALLDTLNQRNGLTLAELTATTDTTRQAVSKHLAVLEEAGLVTSRREGRTKLHFLDAAPIAAITDRWIRPYDRHRAEALQDLRTALETRTPTTMSTTTQQDAPPFVYTTYIRTTPEALWAALTTPEFTMRYWGVGLESDWQVGSVVAWDFRGTRMAEPEQVVLESDPPRRLSYTWHAITDGFLAAVEADDELAAAFRAENLSTVTFEIETHEAETGEAQVKLTVTHSGFREGSAVREGVSQGWPAILSSLKSLLETGAPLS